MKKNQKFHPTGENKKGNLMVQKKVKNFNLGVGRINLEFIRK